MTILAPAATVDSIGRRLLDRAVRSGDADAFRYPTPDGMWASLTWRQLSERATELAAGLLLLGVGAEQRVAIASSTRIEWVLADLAVALAGGVTTTVYPATGADDVAYILTDCAAVAAVVEDAAQVAKLRTADGRWVGQLRHVVAMEPVDDPTVLTLDDLADQGRSHLAAYPDAVRPALGATGPDRLATIVYTSGTTGRPKGVELTHGNWVYLGTALAQTSVLRPNHVHFLWLPLSHVFGKLLLQTQLELGFTVAIDGRIDRIADNLATVRPHAMAAAPRILEKLRTRTITAAEARGGVEARLFRSAFELGIDAVRRTQAGRAIPLHRRLALHVADRLVFAKVRMGLGGRLEVLTSGSAALAPQVAEWFAAAGLPVLEGYGLTETTGASFVNRPGQLLIGTVGQPLPGTEVRLAADGEILMRSPGVMRGYHGLPEQTAAVLDDDGWFATGDIGALDADGYLRITDRKKDLVKTSGGKYIAPTAIESAVKAASPLISAAVLIAEGRNFASLLVTVDPAASRDLNPQQITDAIAAAVAHVNTGLNRWETIKQFRVLPGELSVEAGELTSSLKVKRAAVARNHADLIESIYSGVLS